MKPFIENRKRTLQIVTSTSVIQRWSRLTLFIAVLVSALSPSLLCADGNPDLVGVLAIITEQENSADLGLNEDQLQRLKDLIKQHEAKGLEIAAQLRTLSTSERREKTAEIIRELEAKGMDLLTEPQRVQAERLRLKNLGLAAVLEPEITTSMKLSEAQLAKVKTVLEGRRNLMREMGLERGKTEFNRRLDEILDETQKQKWASMIGAKTGNSTSTESTSSDESQNSASAPRDISVDVKPSDLPLVIDGTRSTGLRLNFNSAPWSEVLKWMSKEAELSLQTDFYPSGTFTYRDPYKLYSLSDAMDVMNYVLINRGYTLIRKDRALMCVDLDPATGGGAEIVRGLVRELAELVSPADLDMRGEYEVCKCAFPLQRISVEDAEKEFKPTLSPHGSIISQLLANQILVTESVGKLRFIRDTIARAEVPEGGRSSKVVVITLKYTGADEVLGIARPLIGLKEMNNVSEELSLSTDAFGRTIFATGSTDKLQRLKDIVAQIDVAPSEEANSKATAERQTIMAHSVKGTDPQFTFDVLQTQFSGQTNIVLGLDPKTSSIIAQAVPSDQKKIEEIIEVLSGDSNVFEIIQLEKLDTQAALLTLEKFYGKQSSKEKDPSNAKGPIFYGDTSTRRIMVRGSKSEVAQVRELLSKVEKSGPATSSIDGNVLVLPYSGKSAERMLDHIDMLWEATKHKEQIRRILPKNSSPSKRETRETNKARSNSTTSAKSRMPNQLAESEAHLNGIPVMLASQIEQDPSDSNPSTAAKSAGDSKDLRIYQGPSGLIVTSDDRELLNEFNKIAEVARGQVAAGPSEPSVIYLQYISALAAEELIRGVLSGSGSSSSGGGNLLGDVASNMFGGGLLGGLLGGMGGGGSSSASSPISSPTASGDVYITPDPRLNALWVQANAVDMQLIESLVEIIDTPNSPVEVQTQGTPEIIYLQTAPVAEVEATVKQVFADRLSQGAGGAGGGAAAQRQPSPQEFIEALRGGGGGGNRRNGPKELKEQTMTVTADKKNNALIVYAQPQLVEKVRALVEQLDHAAEGTEESYIVLPVSGNASVIQSALSNVFGSQAKTNSTQTGAQNNSNRTNTQPSAAAPAPGGGFNPFQGFQNRGGFPAGGAFPGAGGGFPGLGGGAGRFGGGNGGMPGNFQGGQGGGQGNRGGQRGGNGGNRGGR